MGSPPPCRFYLRLLVRDGRADSGFDAATPSGSVHTVLSDDVERLRDAYRAFNEGAGVEAILERLGSEFQVRDRESSPDRETRFGREGIKQLFDSYMEAFDALRLEPQEFIAVGDRIVVSLNQRIRGKGSGAEVVGRVAHVWTMRSGAALQLRIFADKERALEALRAEGSLSGPPVTL
jgi:ketosteroid isomerase-like protein